MSRNWLYLLAVLLLPGLSLLVNVGHYDDWLHAHHYDRAAAIIAALRGNDQFQDFMGGWVFPAFIAIVLIYWIIAEDKSCIPTQFMLLPLAYIPFSIFGFTLAHAKFEFSYLYTNPLIILAFGYTYVLVWAAIVWVFDKLRLVV